MFLLEHDAKDLLAASGVPVPDGIFATGLGDLRQPSEGGSWVVKAQVRAAGRGKQGGIRLADTWAEVEREVPLMLGRSVGGHTVRAVRVERRVAGSVSEAYLSLSIAPAERQVRVIVSGQGGVEIENLHQQGKAVRSALADPDPSSVTRAIAALAGAEDDPVGQALADAGTRLAPVFFTHDLTLLEINPLFVRPDATWCAGDAKVIADENAVFRQPFMTRLLSEKSEFYPDEARKAAHGFDYLVLDPAGEIGLLTTGAGLGMLLIDELRAAGLRPYNFLDVRSGGLHDDPARLVQVLRWITGAPRLRVLFCNIFAGSTDLGVFARLLMQALALVPEIKVPLVIRLVGNQAEAARVVLSAAGLSLTEDLAEAVAQLHAVLADPA